MKKYKVKSCLIMVLVMMVLSVTETVAGNQPASSDNVDEILLADMHTNPLWNNGSFISTPRTGSTSNLELLGNIKQFHDRYLSNSQHVHSNNRTNIAFRQTLSQGFHRDSFLQAKPFNATFIDEILQNVYFCFEGMNDNQQFAGFYRSSQNSKSSHIWANADRRNLCFAFTIIHEMGHALGLGETLADLKAELFMSQARSSRQNYNLVYNSTFDRMLLSAVGTNRFWTAAYHSNAAYGELWDAEFGDIITHRELEVVRGVVLVSASDKRLRNAFETSANRTLEQASVLIHDYFVSLNNGYLSPELRQELFGRLREWVDFYVSFSTQNALRSSYSVHDWIIGNHHIRFA